MPKFAGPGGAMDVLDRFLRENSLPAEILWVFEEDLSWCRGVLKTRVAKPEENKRLAAQLIESDSAARLGVEIRVVGILPATTLCGVVVPSDERNAQELLIDGLKLSAPVTPLRAEGVSNALVWRITRTRNREPTPFEGIANFPER